MRLFEAFVTQIVTQNYPAPLFTDDDGVVRVGGTRVRLDTVVYAFNQGASAEEILQQYPSLALADTYATIGYYLQHRSSVDDYLKERQKENDRVRQLNESRSDPADLREHLLKRNPKVEMLRFAVDEDFDNRIVRGLLRLLPTLDIVRVQDAGLFGKRFGSTRMRRKRRNTARTDSVIPSAGNLVAHLIEDFFRSLPSSGWPNLRKANAAHVSPISASTVSAQAFSSDTAGASSYI